MLEKNNIRCLVWKVSENAKSEKKLKGLNITRKNQYQVKCLENIGHFLQNIQTSRQKLISGNTFNPQCHNSS